jgi:membrane-associated phospholipid phosphatase
MRRALLIGSATFAADADLPQLRCPPADVAGVARILGSPDHGEFDEVTSILDRPYYEVQLALFNLLTSATRDDLILIYYSGHGKLSRNGTLYLTASDTRAGALEATAFSSRVLREYIDLSRCRRVVIFLDCCYAGAAGGEFKGGDIQDQLAKIGSGTGTYLITAANPIQLAQEREGDSYSLFTKHLLAGIESGAADINRDGWIDVDELYDYVKSCVSAEGVAQSPTKWDFDVQGEIRLARSGIDRKKRLRKSLLHWGSDGLIHDRLLLDGLNLLEKSQVDLTREERQRMRLIEELDRGFDPEKKLDWEERVIKDSRRPEPPLVTTIASPRVPLLRQFARRAKEWASTKEAAVVLILSVFLINLIQTALEASPAKGDRLDFTFASAMLDLEGSSLFAAQEHIRVLASALCGAYFLLLPIILAAAWVNAARQPTSQRLWVLTLAVVINYVIALPFFLWMPMPERWALQSSEATLLADLVSPQLMAMLRPISAIDNSFPSFHVSLSALCATLAFLFASPYRYGVLSAAIAVSLSTYLLGVHWIADILAGVGAGMLSAFAATRLAQRIPRNPASDGAVISPSQ